MNFSVLALAELEAAEAVIWYEDKREALGDEFLTELEGTFARIRDTPAAMSKAEWYSGAHDLRRCRLKRFPYVVTFLLRPDEVVVVAVSHLRRRPLYWLQRLSRT